MKVVFEGTSLNVYDDSNTMVIHQPFKPTATGEQLPWTNEAEALAWADENLVLTTPEPLSETKQPVVGE